MVSPSPGQATLVMAIGSVKLIFLLSAINGPENELQPVFPEIFFLFVSNEIAGLLRG